MLEFVNKARKLSEDLWTALELVRFLALSTVHDNGAILDSCLLEDLFTALDLLRFPTRSTVHDSGEPSRVFIQYFRENKELVM